jgi:hypothetical protein
MKATPDEQLLPHQEPDPRVLAREPDMPVSESECPPPPQDEGQTIEEPGYGHGV